jgi:hypothetical protein
MLALLMFLVVPNPLILRDQHSRHAYVLRTDVNGRTGMPVMSFQFSDSFSDERLSFEVKRRSENGSIVQVFGTANWQVNGQPSKRVKAWFWYDGKTVKMKPYQMIGQQIEESVL